jgi:hypothetical protein
MELMPQAPPQQEDADTIVRFLEPTDAPAMRALFHEVFGHEMSEAFWRWKYGEGGSSGVGLFRHGELVSHYGGASTAICFKGAPARAVQIVDVMVKPAARQSVRRKGAFFLAGRHFAEWTVGYDRPFLTGYGFPSERSMALAEHLGLYARVGHMLQLDWELREPEQGPHWWTHFELLDAAGFMRRRAEVESLWRQLQGDLAAHIVVRKDAAWLEHRYLNHPDKQYRLVLLRRRLGRTPLGLVVLKEETGKVQLMDHVGPLRNIPLLLRAAKWHARSSGRELLYTWCSAAFAEHFSHAGAIPRPLAIVTPCTTRMPGPTPDELRDHWWLMPGDTDFL